MASAAEMMARIKSARSQYGRNDSKVVKPKEGRTQIRILQKPGDEHWQFWHDVGVHWIKADADGKPIAVVGCRSATFEQECQVDALIEKVIRSAPDDETAALAKSWQAKKAVYVNALIRSGDEKSETPVVLELSRTTFDAVLSLAENFLEENEFSVFERQGKGLDTKYTVQLRSKPTPVSKESIDKMVDLKTFIEREHFASGKEAAALLAITRITGVSLTGAIAGSKTSAALLTGSSGSVIDAEVDNLDDEPVKTPAKAAAPVAAKPAAKPVAVKDAEIDDLDVDDALKELDDLDD
jgi:hypothetical protein